MIQIKNRPAVAIIEFAEIVLASKEDGNPVDLGTVQVQSNIGFMSITAKKEKPEEVVEKEPEPIKKEEPETEDKSEAEEEKAEAVPVEKPAPKKRGRKPKAAS